MAFPAALEFGPEQIAVLKKRLPVVEKEVSLAACAVSAAEHTFWQAQNTLRAVELGYEGSSSGDKLDHNGCPKTRRWWRATITANFAQQARVLRVYEHKEEALMNRIAVLRGQDDPLSQAVLLCCEAELIPVRDSVRNETAKLHNMRPKLEEKQQEEAEGMRRLEQAHIGFQHAANHLASANRRHAEALSANERLRESLTLLSEAQAAKTQALANLNAFLGTLSAGPVCGGRLSALVRGAQNWQRLHTNASAEKVEQYETKVAGLKTSRFAGYLNSYVAVRDLE